MSEVPCKSEYEDILWDRIRENWRLTFSAVEGRFSLAVSTSIATGVVIGEHVTGVTGALQAWAGRAFGVLGGLVSFALSDREPADAVSAAVDTTVGMLLGELVAGLRAVAAAATSAVESASAAVAAAEAIAVDAVAFLTGAQSVAAEATAARVAAQTIAQQAAASAVTAEEYAAAQALAAAAERAAIVEAAKIAAVGAAERSALAAAADVTAATLARVAAVGALEAASGAVAFVVANTPTIAVALAAVFAGAVLGIFAKSAFEAQEIYNAQDLTPNTLDLREPNYAISEGVTITSLTTYQHLHNPDGTLDEDRRDGISFSIKGVTSGAIMPFDEQGCIEQIILTDGHDELNVSAIDLSQYDDWHFLDNRFIIDMSNREGGNLSSADFDEVRYAARPGAVFGENGVFWYDGETHSAGPISGFLNTIAGYIPLIGALGLRFALYAESKLPGVPGTQY
jgi:hypothetical protein